MGGTPNFENQGAGEGWRLVLLEIKGREQHGDGGVMCRQDDHPSVCFAFDPILYLVG